MKKKLFFFQVNYSYGKAAHIPYTAGQLCAYAFADNAVAENYSLENIFFIREPVESVLKKIDNPAIVAFSTYIWNCNYNKAVAKRIKEKYPDCVIVFGGHHVAPGGEMLEECPYIDYLLHGEGEVIFRRLMRSLIGLDKDENIPGISMRTGSGILTNPEMVSTECDFPSPYTNGYFDKILEEYPDKDFMALIETSRGCPNTCAYCDWSCMKSKIRKFPLERIYQDIDWVKNNRIYGLGSADSNFGMFKRDEEITDRIIASKKETGRPVGFQTSYAKNSTQTVFNIGLKLEKSGMNKGITLSFQSMSKDTLKNIGRENISIDYYAELMNLYNNAGIATYTELILGLPGETYESFTDGIDKLLNLGQHNSIYIHNCEWLPCSTMGKKEYIERYKIGTSCIPLNQPHRDFDDEDEIPEQSRIVTSTCSMTEQDWKKMNLFSAVVQGCHHMGPLQFFAIYLYYENLSSYKNFYSSLLEYFLSNPETVAGKAIKKINECLDNVIAEKEMLCCCDSRFGKILWTFEEYLYLCIIHDVDSFYKETREFLKGFGMKNEIFESLESFQRSILRKPYDERVEITTTYDFLDYFDKAVDGKKTDLKKIKTTVSIESAPFNSWEEFAKVVAWFGKKDGKGTYIKQALLKRRSSENEQ